MCVRTDNLIRLQMNSPSFIAVGIQWFFDSTFFRWRLTWKTCFSTKWSWLILFLTNAYFFRYLCILQVVWRSEYDKPHVSTWHFEMFTPLTAILCHCSHITDILQGRGLSDVALSSFYLFDLSTGVSTHISVLSMLLFRSPVEFGGSASFSFLTHQCQSLPFSPTSRRSGLLPSFCCIIFSFFIGAQIAPAGSVHDVQYCGGAGEETPPVT